MGRNMGIASKANPMEAAKAKAPLITIPKALYIKAARMKALHTTAVRMKVLYTAIARQRAQLTEAARMKIPHLAGSSSIPAPSGIPQRARIIRKIPNGRNARRPIR